MITYTYERQKLTGQSWDFQNRPDYYSIEAYPHEIGHFGKREDARAAAQTPSMADALWHWAKEICREYITNRGVSEWQIKMAVRLEPIPLPMAILFHAGLISEEKTEE